MAGLLSQKRPSGGLLGDAPQGAKAIDYGLALIAGGLRGVAGMALDDRAQRQNYERLAPIAAEMGGLFKPQSQVSQGAMGPGLDGLPTGRSIPQDQRRSGLPSIAAAAPILARAQRMGINVAPYLELLKAGQPEMDVVNGVAYDKRGVRPGERIGVNLQNVNGFQVDQQDPTNANRFVPQIKDGAEPLYDGQRNVVGQRNMLGTTQTLGDQAAATSAGTARGSLPYEEQAAAARAAGQGRGSAPYDLATVQGPDGQPMYGARSQFLGGVAGQSTGDKAYGDKLAGGAADYYQGLQNAGQQAAAKIGTMQQVGKLLQGVDGGSLTPAGLEVARAANSLGFKIDGNLANKEASVALSNQIALGFKDMIPGPLSNADRDYLGKMAPSLAQSAEGRVKLIDAYTKTYQRQQQVAGMARQWQQRFGRIDRADATGKTFQDYLTTWADQNRLFQ